MLGGEEAKVNGAPTRQGNMANMGDDRCDRAAQRFFLLLDMQTPYQSHVFSQAGS